MRRPPNGTTYPIGLLDRRDFLRAAGIGVSALTLPACHLRAIPVPKGAGEDAEVPGDLALLADRPPDLALGEAAVPDLATRDLATRDLATPDLAPPRDFAQPPDLRPSCDKLFNTGKPPKAFLIGTATYYGLGRNEIFVCRDGGGLYSVSALCTHAGCTIAFQPVNMGFHCPCHGSNFDFAGTVTGGPAAKPLEHFGLCIGKDGFVHIDEDTFVAPGVRLIA